MDLNWTLPVLLQHQYSWLMHSLLSVYSLCTLWWRWTCESLCCLLVFWHCQEPEEALRSHPAAACRSKPSTKAAEGRRFFYLELFFFSPKILSTFDCVPSDRLCTHPYPVRFKHHLNILRKIESAVHCLQRENVKKTFFMSQLIKCYSPSSQ